jgi:hypothetical protein
MKTCPKCNSVFTPENAFCLNDGTPLVTEDFVLPSNFTPDEEETVVRSTPIVIDNFTPPPPPPVQNFTAPRAAPKRSVLKYLVFLIAGLFLGVALVLGSLALIAGRFGEPGVSVNSPVNSKPAATAPVVNEKHLARNKTRDDDEFNGVVNTENANIRSAPNSGVQDVLPKADRINIIERENATSPWYRVMCEHGVTGWMHGNTIKFSDDFEAF